jgi:hypothetical protein
VLVVALATTLLMLRCYAHAKRRLWLISRKDLIVAQPPEVLGAVLHTLTKPSRSCGQ